MGTDTRTSIHRHIVVATNLLAAFLAGAQALPARAQGAPMSAARGAQAGGNALLDQLTDWERKDLGVAAPAGLHEGPFHGPTPNQLPGGQVITTKGLLPLLQQQGMQVHVFDVLGGAESLPNAIPAVWAAQAGSFDDATQKQMAEMLRGVTRGKTDAPLVFYCLSPECWMSFNAATRAIHLGYRNVLWYRGGIDAWRHAGLPLSRVGGPGQLQGRQSPASRPPGALPPDAFGAGGRGS
jgi:PQQ-dependent catabolism-associated CXXCW motif protein